ncbi:MAG TPA: pilus assembly protein TadB [Paenibacillaceae bacterium]|nr:pilus assembly protein TadB [Paenibacillaceae bacterium]
MTEITIMIYGALALFLVFAFYYYRFTIHRSKLRDKITAIFSREQMIKKVSWQEKWVKKLVSWSKDLAPLGSKLTFFSKTNDIEKNLTRAGRPFRLQAMDLHGLKMLSAILGLISGMLMMIPLFFLGMAAPLLFLLLGFFIPLLLLKQLGDLRQMAISQELPDFFDTISITLSAGLSLETALQRYVKATEGALSDELSVFNDEVKLGVPREEALMNLAKRTQNPDVENLANDLIQAIRLGVPFAKTFRLQAEGMRKIREERAKDQARKAGPKLALVTTLVFTPSIMIFIIGMLILNFMSGKGF